MRDGCIQTTYIQQGDVGNKGNLNVICLCTGFMLSPKHIQYISVKAPVSFRAPVFQSQHPHLSNLPKGVCQELLLQ